MTSTSAKYFTEAEYKKLLQHANKNYIQIIPYFDLDSTGAARAALRNVAKALPPNVYTTVHKCYRYKYIFFETVLKTLKKYHSDVNHPLTQVGVGGDNPHFLEIWDNSTECNAYLQNLLLPTPSAIYARNEYIKQHLDTLYEMGQKEGIQISAYDNAFFVTGQLGETVVNFNHKANVTVMTQESIREANARPHVLANSGFKVVLSQKDFLNLDHASEPHPEEPGDNYATRFLDARRVYNYLPRNPCCNYMQDMYFWGYQGFQTPSRSGCFPRGHPYCQFPDQTLNIEGVQAKVLTRKIRTEEQLFKALLPRLIAFAERAWHKAPWETYFKPAAANTAAAITAEQTNVDEGVKHRDQHWAQLRNVIGNKELNRLTKMGLKFNIPLPGVSLGNATVENKVTTFPVLTSQLYPGYLVAQMQLKDLSWIDVPAQTFIQWWTKANNQIDFVATDAVTKARYSPTLLFRTRTKDNTGYSRETALTNVEFFSPGRYDFNNHAESEVQKTINLHKQHIDHIRHQQILAARQQQLLALQHQQLLAQQQQQLLAQQQQQQQRQLLPQQQQVNPGQAG